MEIILVGALLGLCGAWVIVRAANKCAYPPVHLVGRRADGTRKKY
jgi:hypothetical protein